MCPRVWLIGDDDRYEVRKLSQKALKKLREDESKDRWYGRQPGLWARDDADSR